MKKTVTTAAIRRPMLREQDLAEDLGVHVSALRNARSRGTSPLGTIPFYKLGTARSSPVRYDPRDRDRFLEQQRRCARKPDGD